MENQSFSQSCSLLFMSLNARSSGFADRNQTFSVKFKVLEFGGAARESATIRRSATLGVEMAIDVTFS